MEQTFQTSFIPKKPIIEPETKSSGGNSAPVGIFMILSIFIFITMLLVTGGLYFYKQILNKQIAELNTSLAKSNERFEASKIQQLQLLDRKLQASNLVLNEHIAISPIFQALSELTMKSVRYTKFTYEFGTEKDKRITVKLNGVAKSYEDIALQASLLSQNKNLIDPVFSNLVREKDKNTVSFNLEFLVDPSFVDYKQVLKSQNSLAEENLSGIEEVIN